MYILVRLFSVLTVALQSCTISADGLGDNLQLDIADCYL